MAEQKNSEEPEEEPKPKLKREPERAGGGINSGYGSGSGKPPRPTAVGLGGSDDEFDPGKLRFYDLDSPDVEVFDWNRVQSNPIAGLRFIRLDTYPRPDSLGADGKTVNAHPVTVWRDEGKLANWVSRCNSKLDELHKKQASIAYYVQGCRTGCAEYFGVSIGASVGASEEDDSVVEQLVRELARPRLLNKQIEQVAAAELIASEEIMDLIEQDCTYSEILTGLPYGLAYKEGDGPLVAEGAPDTNAYGSFWIAMAGLQGHRFGILSLAKPYSEQARRAEELALIRSIETASRNEDPAKKRQLKYYLERQRYYLKMFQQADSAAVWSVSCYAFAGKNRSLSGSQVCLDMVSLTLTKE